MTAMPPKMDPPTTMPNATRKLTNKLDRVDAEIDIMAAPPRSPCLYHGYGADRRFMPVQAEWMDAETPASRYNE
ncbi:hypothetical protein GCM10025857_08620 [Alicyclobacillus contaminans]|nr:hypothetical protein GCM10025857_08620 [Alicyclobacillus contaminans]